MGYVFISYSNKQESFALALNDILNSNGIQTWMDKGNIPPGSKYAVELMRAIKKCSCFVLLVTSDSMNSEWVDKEVERAIHYKKPVFPVKLDDTELNEQFELYLSTYQIIRVDRIDSKSVEIRQLVFAISRCVQDRPDSKSVVSTSGSSDPARSKGQSVSGKIDWAASIRAKENPYRRYISESDTEADAEYVAAFTPKKKEPSDCTTVESLIIDITNVEFSVVINGYSMKAVDTFLDDICDLLEKSDSGSMLQDCIGLISHKIFERENKGYSSSQVDAYMVGLQKKLSEFLAKKSKG